MLNTADEQRRLERMNVLLDFLGMDESKARARIEGACSELDREMGIRERCFPNWIKEGKVSKIDATDRYTRMKYAQEMMHFMLDTVGSTPRMAGDEVPF